MSSKIVLIEDDQTLGEMLKKKLTLIGYTVTHVIDGAEGLKMIRQEKPDLVLLDILLPTMNGYEILEAKRDDLSIKDIPVIIVSNSGQPVELQRVLELGAIDYFIKAQFDPEEIISKVTNLVPPTKIGSPVSLVNKKILLVEDDRFLSDVLTRKFTNEKCEVLHAVTGESSLEMAEREQPHMILLDLVLPGISGFDVLEKLRANPKTKDIRVIILSNLSQQEDIDRANKLGIDAFLVKAMNTPGNIFSKIVSILSSE
ncbi:MAG: hypothetical protein AUK16_00640 [Parcubacteria group bacterium CG2_30_44_11]|nr:MAG: hypothetical protein AUK16_00640 [Parcubacteria group bacterium CG2_30_44_11]